MQCELWPTRPVPCPKCGGARTVYYLHARAPGRVVVVVGGKRIPCPVCHGSGDVAELLPTSNEATKLHKVSDVRTD